MPRSIKAKWKAFFVRLVFVKKTIKKKDKANGNVTVHLTEAANPKKTEEKIIFWDFGVLTYNHTNKSPKRAKAAKNTSIITILDRMNRENSKVIKSEVEIKTKLNLALETGKKLGESLKKLSVKKAVFDRGSYRYHGRVGKIAEGLRSSGILF